MQIILEGPDNAGKSTLAKYLSEKLNIAIQHSGGPSKFPGEVNTRAFEFNQRRSQLIYDRHPCVSQNIYVEALGNGGELVTKDHIDEFYADKPLIIYCRNVRGTEGHELSEHSSGEYFQQVERNMARLCELYDQWALGHATLVYRIGDNMDDIVNSVAAILYSADSLLTQRLSFDPISDIVAFHEKFGLAYNGKPRSLPDDLFSFRIGFMREELDELEVAQFDATRAIDFGDDEADLVHHLEKQLDALVDELYVLLGTAYLMGMIGVFPEAWRRVHEANMKKVRAERASQSTRGSTFDVVKPDGWEPPSHTDLVEDHAHAEAFA